MTLRAVIESLLHGSEGAEARLADGGFGDLPAEMFGQALASYADTAPMAEADALTPVLSSLEAGDAGDVFAILDEQPLTVPVDQPEPDSSLIAASVGGVDAVQDVIDDFGSSVDDEPPEDPFAEPPDESLTDELDEFTDESLGLIEDDPFRSVDVESAGSGGDAESFEDLFESEPEATGTDPSDLDLDF